MKKPSLIFLGTGQGPDVVGKQVRASGGIVLMTHDHQLHIDPGPGSLLMGKEYYVNPRATTGILVSHHHVNHCSDVNALIGAMTFGGLDKKGVLISTSMLVSGDSYTHPYLTEFHRDCLEKFMVLKSGQRAAMDDIEINATTTGHSVEAIGFKVSTPEFCVSYVSDTGYHSSLGHEHKGADILVLNVVNPFGESVKNNLNCSNIRTHLPFVVT